MSQLDPRKDRTEEAAAAKAEAEAASAQAAAAKARADARAAEAAAQKAEQELEDHNAPAAAKQREAEAQQKTAEAEKAAAAARQARFAALIPDLSAVKESTLEAKDGPPLWSSFLLGAAVAAAADAVAAKLEPLQGASSRVLITCDSDLACADATYQDTKAGLDELMTAAENLLQLLRPKARERGLTPIDTALEAAGAVASAVPAVLSLLSAHRTLSTATATASDLAAVAAIAAALKAKESAASLVHDEFRLVPRGGLYERVGEVGAKRHELLALKIDLTDKKDELTAELGAAKAEHDTLRKADQPTPEQAEKIRDVQQRIAQIQQHLANSELRLSLVESLLQTIDSFTAAIRAVPAGARRSALASAALHEELHAGTDGYSHVLLIKTQNGQAQQVLANQPLWMRDKFSIAVDTSITYLLIETERSHLVAAGTETGVASAHGDIGDRPTFDSDQPRGRKFFGR